MKALAARRRSGRLVGEAFAHKLADHETFSGLMI
jgi:hypothetical protein